MQEKPQSEGRSSGDRLRRQILPLRSFDEMGEGQIPGHLVYRRQLQLDLGVPLVREFGKGRGPPPDVSLRHRCGGFLLEGDLVVPAVVAKRLCAIYAAQETAGVEGVGEHRRWSSEEAVADRTPEKMVCPPLQLDKHKQRGPDTTCQRAIVCLFFASSGAYDQTIMAPSPFTTDPQQNLAFSRERDARICWLLETHPVTAAMLVGLGWFPTKKKARNRLRRLVFRKHIQLVGTICRKLGRPEHVYCRFRLKPDQLVHEVELTELCLRLDAGKILRGTQATDERIRPDAEVWIEGRLYYLEIDRGTMGYAQIERRFRLYEGFPHLSLWVCSTPARMEGFRQQAEKLRHSALFTTLTQALSSPHGEIWIDYAGGRAALPREVGFKPGLQPGS